MLSAPSSALHTLATHLAASQRNTQNCNIIKSARSLTGGYAAQLWGPRPHKNRPHSEALVCELTALHKTNMSNEVALLLMLRAASISQRAARPHAPSSERSWMPQRTLPSSSRPLRHRRLERLCMLPSRISSPAARAGKHYQHQPGNTIPRCLTLHWPRTRLPEMGLAGAFSHEFSSTLR